MSKEQDQVHNQSTHLHALSATKLGDGLVDPKLVLSWLLTTLGASTFWIGMLVPVREAGALLPQLFTAQKLRHVAVRKWWWIIGSVVQGAMVLVMLLAALYLEGRWLGAGVVAALAVFATARSICSVSYKDVLGKTVEKARRGRVTGTASSVAAVGVLGFGLLLIFSTIDRLHVVYGALGLASVLWFFAARRFISLIEAPSEINVDKKENVWRTYLGYVKHDRELQKFLLVRGLLTVTAIAPPFLIIMADQSSIGALVQIGGLVIASSFATFVSGWVWGRLADRSTPKVLGFAGLACGAFLLLSVAALYGGWYEKVWFLPLVLFGVMVSYQGVRIARSIHLVNLASEETRAAYTAVSNTVIGIVLLFSGVFGLLAELTGITIVVSLLAGLSLLGGFLGLTLKKP